MRFPPLDSSEDFMGRGGIRFSLSLIVSKLWRHQWHQNDRCGLHLGREPRSVDTSYYSNSIITLKWVKWNNILISQHQHVSTCYSTAKWSSKHIIRKTSFYASAINTKANHTTSSLYRDMVQTHADLYTHMLSQKSNILTVKPAALFRRRQTS